MDLKVRGFVRDPAILDDAQAIRSFLADLTAHLGMTIINGPTVTSFKEFSGAQDAGLSGIVTIAESHIAIHTWPEREWLRVDICSCKAFSHINAIQFIIERLDITQVQRVAVDFEDGGPTLRPRSQLPEITPREFPIHQEVVA